MISKACALIAAFWMVCAANNEVVAQTIIAQPQYRFQHYEMKDGLPFPGANSIAQDKQGFIWFQSYTGLSRFDGYNFKDFKPDPDDTLSLPPGGVGIIFADSKGNIWVTAHTSTNDFPISKYDPKTEGFITYRPVVKALSGFLFDKKDPLIWFSSNGNGLYSFNTETRETRNYVYEHSDSLIQERGNHFFGIADGDSVLLMGSLNGLWEFEKRTGRFRHPKCNPADSVLLYHTPIWDVEKGSNKDVAGIWLWSNRKFVMVDYKFSVVKTFDFPGEFFPNMYALDKEGVLWFKTRDDRGLYRYNSNDNSLINIRHIPGDPTSLKSDFVAYLKVDREENIWIASDKGVSRLQNHGLRFHNFTMPGRVEESTVYHANERDFVIANQVNHNVQDIWVAPIIHDRLDKLQFEKVTTIDNSPFLQGIWKGKRNVWISLYGRGIAHLPVDPKSGRIMPGKPQFLSHDPKNASTIGSNLTTFVWEDAQENLWVGTRGSGLSKVNPGIPYGKAGSVKRYMHIDHDPNSLDNDIVWNLCPEGENSFWVITDTGVDLFRNERFEHIFKSMTSPAVYMARDSVLFISAAGSLFKGIKHNGRYTIGRTPLLKTNDVLRIQDDNLGRLWITTTTGIVCYDRNRQLAIEFNEKDGFDHVMAQEGPVIRQHLTSQGIMMLSDAEGICLFDPLSLTIDTTKTYPVFTGLKVNNQDPVIEARAGVGEEFTIKQAITDLDELLLDYLHNNFSIEFSAMEMTSPDKNRYRHKLEGYDKDWIETDWKNRTATYTNLDAADYVFHVKASNHHGIWSDQETILAVRILPPPWKTWWAYSLYTIALIGVFLSWRRYDIKRVKLKHRAEQLSELDHLKTRFFANISHEFRTPITLILGPLKEMYNGTFKGDQKPTMGVMMRNGQRLLRLINQLLDLSKLEAGKMALQPTPVDLVQFLKETSSSYESMAVDKKIKFFFYPEVPELILLIDQEKMEKVMHNLLSNAFKFTKENGEVILNLKTEERQCVIIVKDTGIGIPAIQLDKVFDRFYQVDSSQTRGYEGSGLGMALAKELVELHKGKISVESKEGVGTTFAVYLPLGKEHLRKEEITDLGYSKKAEMASDVMISEESPIQLTDEKETVPVESQPVLLIVEDNADMRHYIRKTLSDQYQIIEAENGKTGVKMAGESIPDLIISDIMMPEMDGYKLCELIKTNETTSHIPVILLTAKADRESRLTGLETGADDYLSKPFDADELRLIVRNRIEERNKMKERFSREVTLEPRQISITSLDEKFITKVLAIIEAHMDDEDFSIDELSREAGYSNMHFYRKIKALAGQTPSQFLRTIRLKRAAELLSKNSDNVTQIAYSVGFSSLSYFNKCFKEQFGMTPGQFAETSFKSKV